MKFVRLINLKLLTISNSFLLNIAEHENFSAINMKMPTVVGIFIFISRESFMLSSVEHEKKFYNLGACPLTESVYIVECIKELKLRSALKNQCGRTVHFDRAGRLTFNLLNVNCWYHHQHANR